MSKYKVLRITANNSESTGEIVGPDAYNMARRLGEHWAKQPENKAVTLLQYNDRADKWVAVEKLKI